MSKFQVAIRATQPLLDRLDEDVIRLRRSRASIMLEIVEKHYKLTPPNNTSKKPTKKAGAR
jgi:predicted DNA-binding protein